MAWDCEVLQKVVAYEALCPLNAINLRDINQSSSWLCATTY